MTNSTPRGGEPDGARLIELARAELLDKLLPQLDGEARYRARLIANALKVAAQDLQAAPKNTTSLDILTDDLAGRAAKHREGQGADPDPARALCQALRRGALDGDPEVYALLVRLTGARRAALG